MTATTPDDRHYHDGDLWVKVDGDHVRIGITDFAQDQLGEIVFVDVPAVGDRVTRGESLGEIESVKTVSELVSPVSGTVVDANSVLEDQPDVVNASPYDEGWIAVIEVEGDPVAGLLSADEYAQQRS